MGELFWLQANDHLGYLWNVIPLIDFLFPLSLQPSLHNGMALYTSQPKDSNCKHRLRVANQAYSLAMHFPSFLTPSPRKREKESETLAERATFDQLNSPHFSISRVRWLYNVFIASFLNHEMYQETCVYYLYHGERLNFTFM